MKKVLLSLGALCSVALVNAQQRVPLFEVFTSSTCGPCNPGNATYEGVVSSKPAGEYVSVKYQQNFPGTGDPYCTNETVNRRSSYYAINSIPRMEIDGGWDQNAQSFTNTLYNQYRAIPAQFNLTGTYMISNKVVTAKLKYSPLNATVATNVKLYVAIIESKTVQNVKSNGETQFFNVVKKMMPTDAGTNLTGLAVGQTDSTTLTYTFAGNFRLPSDGQPANRINLASEYSVENFNNLRVVAWVQGTDKKVHQAANLSRTFPVGVEQVSNNISSVNVYPNPAINLVTVDMNMAKADNVTAMIVNLTGGVVATRSIDMQAGKNSFSFDTQNLANGFYNIILLDSRNNSFAQQLVVAH